MSGLTRKSVPYFILLLAVVFGFWQVSFLNGSLKWDLIDVVFPFRYYFSTCIQSGYFPFWNPYLQTGTPFFADLQAPVFYPELLFTSLLSRYEIFTMHFWFVVYLFIAAVGMYRLSYFFNQNTQASLVAGMAYAFSGFIVAHGQHFFLLVGAAWIPHVITEYLQLAQKRNFFNTLKTAVFVFLMITGAYQALSFTLFYLLLSIFIYYLVIDLSAKNRQNAMRWFTVNAVLLLIVLVFTLPMIVATFEIITSVDRLEKGVTLTQTLGYGQTLKSVISFVLPFSTQKYDEFFGVDISMRNHYFGLIPLLFFVVALLRKQSQLVYLFLVFGVVIFASSFAFLPFREWLFRFVPLMNLFKYAAFIRIFGLLAFILLAANYLAYFQQNFQTEKRKVLIMSALFVGGLLFLVIYSSLKSSPNDLIQVLSSGNSTEILKNLNFHQHIFIQAIIQLFVLSMFLLIVFFREKLRNPDYWITALIFVELFAATQMNMNATVADSAWKPRRMNNDLALYPDKFVIPVNDKIIYNNQLHEVFQPFWRNTYVFSKQISFDAFSSFELKSFNKLDDDFLKLRDAVLNNHLFYFSDRILPVSQFTDSIINRTTDNRVLYFSEADYKILSKMILVADSSGTVKITEFSPNRVTIETHTQNNQLLTMLQTSFKGWQAKIDGEVTPIYTSNFNYRTIYLPAGKHTVVFEYKNPGILWLYAFSNICFALVVLFLLGFGIRKVYPANKIYIIVPVVLLLVFSFIALKKVLVKNENLTVHEYYNRRWNDTNLVYGVQKDYNNIQAQPDSVTGLSIQHGLLIKPENEYFTLVEIPADSVKIKSGTLVVRSEFFANNYTEALMVSDIAGEKQANNWHASKFERYIENPNQWNRLIYFRNFYNLGENDMIKVYVWNLNKTSFAIDSVSVEIYPLPVK
jgi:hypothetical protein